MVSIADYLEVNVSFEHLVLAVFLWWDFVFDLLLQLINYLCFEVLFDVRVFQVV